ncbi:hypothetical protein JOY44_11925 [Phormidium sp. CLA17]|uniref:hypothetical protein n=1 Tax=Leptolyngbya sp. Cla-17 TaxID=2803751 RepID=UPI001492A11E|nr:hypothetical protein [Leptolyngbya sp. Cla-17]MBM0742318.1 hypothetical protein [Leptolyngbya sp. Cla-17]
MLYFLRLTGVCAGLVAAVNLAIAPQPMAQPDSIPVQVAYSKLDVNAVDLYNSEPGEPVLSDDSEEAAELDSASDGAMPDNSPEETSLQ